jgi:cytochrome c oxidase assembly factor CtaG/cytochrome c2
MRACRTSVATTALGFLAGEAAAHPLDADTPPQAALRTWSSEPAVLIGLFALAIAYGVVVRRMRARNPTAVPAWQIVAFSVGWLAAAAALVSPIDALGSVLFSAHMVQHEILMIVAAPLMVVGTRSLMTAGRLRSDLGFSILLAWILHAAAIVAWHVPALFDAAVHYDVIHALQHLSFFGTAVLFWLGVLRCASHLDNARAGVAVVSIFTTAAYTTALGALLTVAPKPWYSAYSATTAPWGLTPLEDQQLGGLVMWVPGGIVYTAAGLWLFAKWLKGSGLAALKASSATTTIMIIVFALGAGTFLTACDRSETYHAAAAMTGGDPERGSDALASYGCTSCHTIPGIREARGLVGPPLTSIGSRVYLAGRLPNTPDNIKKWIQHPRAVDEKTAMPETGVTDADARDIAAYLYTLR